MTTLLTLLLFALVWDAVPGATRYEYRISSAKHHCAVCHKDSLVRTGFVVKEEVPLPDFCKLYCPDRTVYYEVRAWRYDTPWPWATLTDSIREKY